MSASLHKLTSIAVEIGNIQLAKEYLKSGLYFTKEYDIGKKYCDAGVVIDWFERQLVSLV